MWFTNMKAALATCKDDIFPPGAANNWWIRARSSYAGMRAVLSEPTPRVEQNPALFVTLLRCGRMLKSGPGLRHNHSAPSCEHASFGRNHGGQAPATEDPQARPLRCIHSQLHRTWVQYRTNLYIRKIRTYSIVLNVVVISIQLTCSNLPHTTYNSLFLLFSIYIYLNVFY